LPITRHQRALPQYVIGHAARITALEEALHNRQGLFLSGNYLRGISLGDSIKQALQVAEQAVGGKANFSASSAKQPANGS
jgi:oxygen-dependent protoporphyrinogen oxidase